MKRIEKNLALCVLFFCTVSISFAQIYRGEGETKNGTVAFRLNFVEYTGYSCLFYIDGTSIFLDEDNITQFETVLEKFIAWEEMAEEEQITLTKTIDSVTFTSFHYNYTFFKEPVTFYFVFTGGPVENTGEEQETRYTLYIDTTLDRIVPFRLSSKTVEEMYLALSPEKLTEARDAYERQRALEEMFQ